MNLRRGTFRLWVLLSVLFAVGVGAFSFSEIRTEFRYANTDWNAEFAKYGGVNLVPAECDKSRGQLGTDFTRNADGLCWYEFYRFRSLYPEYKDVSDKDLSEKLYAKAGKPLIPFHPWGKVAEAVGVAAGVPLAVLVIGYMLFWAVEGFKAQPTK